MKDLPSKTEIINAIKSGIFPKHSNICYKLCVPQDPADLARLMVALANSGGGYIIIGINRTPFQKESKQVPFNETNTLRKIDDAHKLYTTGINIQSTLHHIGEKPIIIIHAEQHFGIAYFSRHKTSPERRVRYQINDTTIKAEASLLYKKVYKYMSLDSFISSLYCHNWRFFEPSVWNDKFERRFYHARYKLPQEDGSTPELYASCVTRTKNSEAAWKVYSHGEGLGRHCVQLELDITNLRHQLEKTQYHYYENEVDYQDEVVILNMHRKREKRWMKYYNTYFAHFNLLSYIRLLSLKRDAYSYEHEVRLFLIPDLKQTKPENRRKKARHLDIPINWKEVLKGVRIDRGCSPTEIKAIQQACFSAGIIPDFGGKLNIFGSQEPPSGAIPIKFVLFDIDEMPGPQRICIY